MMTATIVMLAIVTAMPRVMGAAGLRFHDLVELMLRVVVVLVDALLQHRGGEGETGRGGGEGEDDDE